ncbi:enolase C-terminal domain-like protein [Pantoea dispersa]|uniref:enolase C-terminal domain-like protein n=1 Tax=Pantoea dispersa TaxID=59814 RepID=UPI002860375A|nr:enolase C-terminal domain-like protein [Pantoea dispersa]MDR6295072.1 L-rhamnonate dehydratase [Pantoea dispersa]
MKIIDVRLLQVKGVMPGEGDFWEERLARPTDVYAQFRTVNNHDGGVQLEDGFAITTVFLEIVSDEGVDGLAGPVPHAVASIIHGQLRPLLLGQDPRDTERLWDQMYRAQIHGRQGDGMLAISAVDCALWDLRAKWMQQPVFRLLGGSLREEIPAYASMLGFAVQDMARVHERALEYKALEYRGQKWFFRHGPMSGREGLKKNIELAKTLREAVGDDYDLMFDCWQSMDVTYLLELAKGIEPYRPRWLEECVMADRISSMQRLKDKLSIPMAGGEHEYTRWGFKRFFESGALDVIQPDIYWCGGLSETLKIAAIATLYDLQVIPHGHSSIATAHFSTTQSPIHTPYQEYLVKWNDIHQYFLRDPLVPQNGLIPVPQGPGMGMALNPAHIQQQTYLFTS